MVTGYLYEPSRETNSGSFSDGFLLRLPSCQKRRDRDDSLQAELDNSLLKNSQNFRVGNMFPLNFCNILKAKKKPNKTKQTKNQTQRQQKNLKIIAKPSEISTSLILDSY